MKVEVLIVPDSNPQGRDSHEKRLDAADIGQDVEDGVAGARYYEQLQAHLDGYRHLHVPVLLVGQVCHLDKFEYRVVLYQG